MAKQNHPKGMKTAIVGSFNIVKKHTKSEGKTMGNITTVPKLDTRAIERSVEADYQRNPDEYENSCGMKLALKTVADVKRYKENQIKAIENRKLQTLKRTLNEMRVSAFLQFVTEDGLEDIPLDAVYEKVKVTHPEMFHDDK